MKKLITILFALTIIFASCTKSPEQKAQTCIKDYLKKHLNDVKSYEPVEFGKLDTFKTVFEKSVTYEFLNKDIEFQFKLADEAAEDFKYPSLYDSKTCINQQTECLKKIDSLQKIIKIKKSEFKPQEVFSMLHKFRAKNAMGGMILNEVTFIITKDFKETLELKDFNYN